VETSKFWRNRPILASSSPETRRRCLTTHHN
jgi:hypothetical protein